MISHPTFQSSQVACPSVCSNPVLQDSGRFSLDTTQLPFSQRFSLSTASSASLCLRRARLHHTRPFARISGPEFPQFSLPDFSQFSLPWLNQKTMTEQARVDLSGTWLKDGEKSESLEDALKLMQLGGLVRTAIRLIRGLEIKQNDKEFEFGLFSVIPWFKVIERYPLTGEPAECKRRDLRGGRHKGTLEMTSEKAILTLEWPEPLGGNGVDEFWLSGENELSVKSTIHVGEGSATYTQVYKRK